MLRRARRRRAACTCYQLTQDTGGDIDRAMNRLLDMAPGTEAPPPPARPAAPPALPAPPAYAAGPDEDHQMQMAMAASMAERPEKRERPSEDEELMRVLAESVQSESQRGADASDEYHALDRLRTDGGYVARSRSPTALVPKVPVHTAVALSLQALYAVPRARDALLTFPLPETVTALGTYWAGAPPTRAPSDTPVPAELAAQVAWIQRVQTLFVAMQHTSRAALVLGDVVDCVPSDVLLQASRNADMHVLLELLLEALVHAYVASMRLASERIMCASRTETAAARAEAQARTAGLFQSYAAVALPAAPDGDAMPPSGEAQPTATITLVHTETENFVQACLFAKLKASSEMDSLLMTHAADVLLLNVQHEPGAVLTPFRIEPEVNLAPFLWRVRRGARIDADPRWEQLQTWEAERAGLAQQRAHLAAPNGTPLEPLLRGAERVDAAGADYAELAAYVREVRDALDAEIRARDTQLAALHTEIVETRRALVAELPDAHDEHASYALCAVLLASSAGDCAYVREDAQWWRIEHGHADRVAWDAVCGDRRGIDEGRGVFHLAYTKMPSPPRDTDALSRTAPATVQAVCEDNARAQESRCT